MLLNSYHHSIHVLLFLHGLWAKSANVCLYLLPPIPDHVIVHLGGNSCATFYTPLSAREYSKMKLKHPSN